MEGGAGGGGGKIGTRRYNLIEVAGVCYDVQ